MILPPIWSMWQLLLLWPQCGQAWFSWSCLNVHIITIKLITNWKIHQKQKLIATLFCWFIWNNEMCWFNKKEQQWNLNWTKLSKTFQAAAFRKFRDDTHRERARQRERLKLYKKTSRHWCPMVDLSGLCFCLCVCACLSTSRMMDKAASLSCFCQICVRRKSLTSVCRSLFLCLSVF